MNLYASAPPIVLADPGDWGHMGGWRGSGMAVFGWLYIALITVLVVRMIWTTTRSGDPRRSVSHSTALEALDGRYARSEIEREEYLQRKGDLRA